MPKLTKNPTILQNILVNPQQHSITISTYSQQLSILAQQNLTQFQSHKQSLISILDNMTSISSDIFIKLFTKILQTTTYNTIQSNCNILLHLIIHKYDNQQVISQMKRCKHIDPVLLLALLWKYHDTTTISTMKQYDRLKCIIKIIDLILVSYPVDLILNGAPYLAKWAQLIQGQVELCNKGIQLVETIERLCREYGKIGKDRNNYVDIYIPL